ncbi:MAG: GNAT family N-acetyltransferase [Candidatus Competibacter sp.]|nr:GNAT family N-acetyltransferase [Candidatus Competibacter sp.]
MSTIADPVYHTRDYQPGDETAITTLFGTVFGHPLTDRQWRWKYVGTGLSPPLARLAFAASGKLVGHVGAIPLRGWRHDRVLPFFQICDVMVDPGARGQVGGKNLFTRLARELLGELAERWPNAFAYGFPGWRPFRLGEYARVYAQVEQAPSMEWPIQRGTFPFLYARPLAWDDPRLDALWARLAPGFALALVRDHPYLRWRYASNPFRTYELLGLYLAGRLLGWSVVLREDDRLKVIDLLVSNRWLRPALAALDRTAASAGATRVEIWLPSSWRKKAGAPQNLTGIVVANMVWKLPITTVEVMTDLYYTMGDLDIF